MSGDTLSEPAGRGRLAENVVHFVRVLRAAGLPLGTDRALLALKAIECAGTESRAVFQAALRTCLVDRPEHLALFDQAFAAFWRDPDILGRLLRLRLPVVTSRVRAAVTPASPRLAQALAPDAAAEDSCAPRPRDPLAEIVPAALSWSDRERLRKLDFEQMTTSEWHSARRLIATLDPLLPHERTRRRQPAARGSISMRRALHEMIHHGGELARLPRCELKSRRSPLVLLIDISGSMSRYSRMLLHFAQQLCGGEGAANRRVQVFVFGTRLTPITRSLARRDPDVALDAVVRAVDDWAGGTRIAHCLAEYNRRWLNRTGGGRATVLLATDGLDHADFDALAQQTHRLQLGCRRLLWLNPLLRYEQFEPRARGVQAMRPYVDRLLPMHNVAALESLAQVLGAGARREDSPWR
jgi:uncharacterized protein with von Willebrand factor type A (vWA) domain